MPIVIETFDEFDARHGGNAVVDGQVTLWPDGARCMTQNRDQRMEPPEDEQLRLRLQGIYLNAVINKEVQEFHAYKTYCGEQAILARNSLCCPPPPPEAADLLRAGKARIEKLRAQLSELAERVIPLPEDQERREHAEAIDRARAAVAEQWEEIQAIEL